MNNDTFKFIKMAVTYSVISVTITLTFFFLGYKFGQWLS